MEELPYALLSYSGGVDGFPKQFEGIVKQHFRIVYCDEFFMNKQELAAKIQAVLTWWGKPRLSRELLQILPNLKAVGSQGAGVDHMDLQLISSFGVKVASTPNVGNDATADMAMALMLASAKHIVEGKNIMSLGMSVIEGKKIPSQGM
ncbi:hypothetical protein NDU88_005673 [Pleurodeles waltl]|uniref:D-isomer specific 2-hydroxyacid dehydrogenase catalytic domain-containing protein n=1 Tax=Pleurodeles waltl TaxID=8319 RepID=A0AAV7VMH0_PLEWA|nr:hypothetical protein NDU88_005673 [Pleurodeles waltl]